MWFVLALACVFTVGAGAQTIHYVQGNDATPQSPQSTVTVAFTGSQAAGDLNVIVAGWNDSTAIVSSVTDSNGNTYTRAAGPTIISGNASQSIYYAQNISAAGAGANAVTVTFSVAAVYPDIRILEYKGADPNNPVDVIAAKTGASTSTSSGSATTTNATDLLLGANYVATGTTAAGSGFTSRMITQPDGDIVEDRMVTAKGSYSAAAPLGSSGWWIMQMVAFRAVALPTTPTNLTATAVSASQINLNWTASTSALGIADYIVQRCSGASCTNFAQIATPTGTSYSDTGLAASTSYRYRVEAVDTAGNLSSFSSTATATTSAGQQPPTAPTNLTATAVSPSQINLNWTASTSIIGIANYIVQRCKGAGCTTFAQVTTPAGTSYNDTGLTSSTSYSYRVQAVDTAGNLSSFSATATASTQAAPPPTAPTNLVATAASATQINLSWTASTSAIGIANYVVQRCQAAGCTTFAQVATPAGTSYGDTGLSASTSYSYRVQAVDTAGSLSSFSSTATASTQAAPPPTAPTNLAATAASASQINLSWTASTSAIGIANYIVQRCQGGGCTTFAQVATPTGTSYSDTGLTANTSYSYRVEAVDTGGNLSSFSSTATAVTQAPPTAPTNLTATASSMTQINLSWTASTSAIGIANYIVQRCQGAGCATFAQVATPTGTSYGDTGLSASTSYSYRVQAVDTAGNLSSFSTPASATTPADTQPPTAPTNLTATAASSSQINLSWSASTDNVGVTGYLVQRCQGAGCTSFAQIATPTGTAYTDTGLSPGASYTYQVQATDAAGNLSSFSSPATAVTQSSTGNITFVQGNYAVPQSPQSGVTVAFTGAQAAGDLNVVVVGWNDSTATITAVTDKNGNTYTRAAGPTILNGLASQSIYYAANIAAAAPGANTVTVTFSTAAQYPDVRILEYSGANATNPVDVTGAQTGNSATTSSGALTTTNVNDLLLATNYVATGTTGPGAGFLSRMITLPDGDIVEDMVATAPGSYSATAPVSSSGWWVMQTVAFRPAPGGSTTPPTAPGNLTGSAVSQSQINLSWTASLSNVGIAYYSVQRCLGSGCTNYTQVATPTTITYSDTGLTPSTSYTYQVLAGDTAGNLSAPSNTAIVTTLPPDTQPPTAPTNLTATAVSGSQINLSWTASTDNVGVTGYRVEYCQGAGCSNFSRIAIVTATTYSSTGLVPGTIYTFEVVATDAAGNLSPASNPASATTLSAISGLVAAYSFDEGAGTTATDSSGNNNTGNISNPLWVAGKYGNAISFSSASTLVTVPDSPSLDLTSAMTLEGWVLLYGEENIYNAIIYKGYENYYLDATTDHGVPGGGGTFGSTDVPFFGTTPVSASTWTHLALTYDGSTLRYYVNGIQVSSQPQGGNLLTSTNPLQIGGDSYLGQNLYGVIDEVRIYNVALTQAQIQTDMSTPIGSSGTVPVATLTPSNLTFASQAVGTTSVAQQLTLTNNGGAPLAISSITITGPDTADFAQTNNCGSSVAANSSCTINVTFSPVTTGSRGAFVTITGNAATTPQSSLTGTGTGFAVTPRVVELTYKLTQQFTANGSGVTWSVDGVAGGSASTGTITSGLYTPPATAGVHTITAATTTPPQSAGATVYITNYAGMFTHHNDNLRTGQNLSEIVLTPANVNAAQFGKLFTYTVDGIMFASPLYVANVGIPNQGFHNVVYLATEHDSVYAFDADSGNGSPLWQMSFINPAGGVTTVPSADTGEATDIRNEIGITGTPVIDPGSSTLYVVAKTKEVTGSNTSYVQRLHALDITTGAEKFGGPIVIQASVPGTGDGGSGGQVPFNALTENQRPALLLNNGVVYVGFASHGDYGPWHGWLLGYNASTLQQVMVYNVTPNSYGGGIWQSGGGPGVDAAGNLYFATGNGGFDANTGGADYGETIEKISTSGAVRDYFAPWDEASLSAANMDLASAGPVLLLDQTGGSAPHLLISASKNGTIYVINRDNMGKFNSSNDSQIVQSLVNALPSGQDGGNFSAPVYFNGYVYFGAVADTLKAFQMTNGLLSGTPTSQSTVTYPNRGAAFALSANGSSNGILWAVQDNSSFAVSSGGALFAYDALNLGIELYNSSTSGSRDTLGTASKFNIPLVANGKVFVAAQNQLVVYSLLP